MLIESWFKDARGDLQSAGIVEYAKRDKVYAKGLGILDNVSTLC